VSAFCLLSSVYLRWHPRWQLAIPEAMLADGFEKSAGNGAIFARDNARFGGNAGGLEEIGAFAAGGNGFIVFEGFLDKVQGVAAAL
jgi:hypothetical protein